VRKVINHALLDETTWTEGGLVFRELVRQGYSNSAFSAGTVEGAGVDTAYLRWQKDGGDGGMLLLRPDEMAAIAYVAAGMAWSVLLEMQTASARRRGATGR
jgi:hypothetical protein